ncbi:MAG TPA: hypothetical protein VKJ65_06585, partial [Phycisphaerae bacterium]|nr:hypothetical protein [Phycisphaerae bacterium]
QLRDERDAETLRLYAILNPAGFLIRCRVHVLRAMMKPLSNDDWYAFDCADMTFSDASFYVRFDDDPEWKA